MRIVLLSLLVASLPILAQCHSWIECADYQDNFATPTSNSYNKALCKGFMRGWTKLGGGVQNTFGSGGNACAHCRYQNGALKAPTDMLATNMNSDTCLYSKTGTGNYDATYPAPVYTKNQKVRLVWPGKNHGGPGDGTSTCVANHGDAKDQLHVACNVDGDISISTMVSSTQYLAVDMKKTTQTNAYGATNSTGLGFKNCPFHCADTNNALCYGDFIVPPNLPAGNCTFYWLWESNTGEYYTTCWEAQIQADAATTGTSSSSTSIGTTGKLSSGSQAGIAIGVVAVGLVGGMAVFYFAKKKNWKVNLHMGAPKSTQAGSAHTQL